MPTSNPATSPDPVTEVVSNLNENAKEFMTAARTIAIDVAAIQEELIP